MDIEWEDPPEEAIIRSRNSGAKYIDFAIALRSHRDKWAVLPIEQPYASLSSAQSAAQNIRRAVTKAFSPKGAYEAVASSDGAKIWVRYVGAPEQSTTPPSDLEHGSGEEGDAERDADFAPRVRAWARENDIPVPARGRLPENVIARYCDVTKTPRPAHLQAVN